MTKSRFKRLLKYSALFFALVALAAAIIIFPERYVLTCFTGFAMWAECVLPSLFPFMVITLILVKTGLAEKASLPLRRVTGLFRLPPASAACFLLSALSGYPAGSRVLSEFYDGGSLTKSDCQKLSYLCSTSGPLFIIGSVGFKMFGDKIIGLKILAAHLLSVIITSLVIALLSKSGKSGSPARKAPDKNVLYNSFYGAVIAVAVAGGFIAFFCVTAQIFSDFNLLKPLQLLLNLFMDEKLSSAICTGLIEPTTGCRAIAALSGEKLAVALAGFLITFGGVSIILQQLSYLLNCGVNPFKFVAVKLIQAAICFVFLLLTA
ncbi:MAG: hypothetical protein K2I20_06000 [Clostridia bacterium]|nr:hypothetical protein [Clostridia bacterium]